MTSGSTDDNVLSPANLRGLALTLIHEVSTMTLATSGRNGPWAAPVYYVYQNGLFYFFSKPDSRHILDALETGSAAAAIHASANSWRQIRGVQMSGGVKKVGLGLNSVKAVQAYMKRFAFTSEFFTAGQDIDLSAFYNRFKVHLYFFAPRLTYYQDNQIRFGFREIVHLENSPDSSD